MSFEIRSNAENCVIAKVLKRSITRPEETPTVATVATVATEATEATEATDTSNVTRSKDLASMISSASVGNRSSTHLPIESWKIMTETQYEQTPEAMPTPCLPNQKRVVVTKQSPHKKISVATLHSEMKSIQRQFRSLFQSHYFGLTTTEDRLARDRELYKELTAEGVGTTDTTNKKLAFVNAARIEARPSNADELEDYYPMMILDYEAKRLLPAYGAVVKDELRTLTDGAQLLRGVNQLGQEMISYPKGTKPAALIEARVGDGEEWRYNLAPTPFLKEDYERGLGVYGYHVAAQSISEYQTDSTLIVYDFFDKERLDHITETFEASKRSSIADVQERNIANAEEEVRMARNAFIDAAPQQKSTTRNKLYTKNVDLLFLELEAQKDKDCSLVNNRMCLDEHAIDLKHRFESMAGEFKWLKEQYKNLTIKENESESKKRQLNEDYKNRWNESFDRSLTTPPFDKPPTLSSYYNNHIFHALNTTDAAVTSSLPPWLEPLSQLVEHTSAGWRSATKLDTEEEFRNNAYYRSEEANDFIAEVKATLEKSMGTDTCNRIGEWTKRQDWKKEEHAQSLRYHKTLHAAKSEAMDKRKQCFDNTENVAFVESTKQIMEDSGYFAQWPKKPSVDDMSVTKTATVDDNGCTTMALGSGSFMGVFGNGDFHPDGTSSHAEDIRSTMRDYIKSLDASKERSISWNNRLAVADQIRWVDPKFPIAPSTFSCLLDAVKQKHLAMKGEANNLVDDLRIKYENAFRDGWSTFSIDTVREAIGKRVGDFETSSLESREWMAVLNDMYAEMQSTEDAIRQNLDEDVSVFRLECDIWSMKELTLGMYQKWAQAGPGELAFDTPFAKDVETVQTTNSVPNHEFGPEHNLTPIQMIAWLEETSSAMPELSNVSDKLRTAYEMHSKYIGCARKASECIVQHTNVPADLDARLQAVGLDPRAYVKSTDDAYNWENEDHAVLSFLHEHDPLRCQRHVTMVS